ncbi:MAG TPA: RAD55 family ATPase [Thermoplasmata archaeon]|nr:RAD55 family ATPase [Thermoplasmata archaeon]
MTADRPVFGIPGLDAAIRGGMHGGWLALLLDTPGAGAQLLAKQFAGNAPSGGSTLFYSSTEREDRLPEVFHEFGWAPDGIRFTDLNRVYFARMHRRELETAQARERGLSLAELAPADAGGEALAPGGVSQKLLSDLSQLDGPFRLVLDSSDFLFEVLDPLESTKLVRQVRNRALELGGEALVLLNPAVVDARHRAFLEGIADIVLRLEAEVDLGLPRRQLRLDKLRNHPERCATFETEPTPGGFRPAGNLTPGPANR